MMDFEHLRIKDVRTVIRYSPSNKRWSAQKRRDHFVGIQLRGAALHTFSDRQFVLSGNCIYFFNQRDDYDVEVYEECESFSVHFTTYEEIETPSFCLSVDHLDPILSLLQKSELLSKTRGNSDLLLLSTVYKLCDSVASARQKGYFQRDLRLYASKNYMDLHFKESDCLATAIAQSGLSSRRFNDLFRQSFDTTPNRYLTMQKIQYAKTLLEMQSLTVSEIAEFCGFSDVYYFSKVFKQICGVPPSKWK